MNIDKEIHGDSMNELLFQIIALTLAIILGIGVIYSIRLYLEI